VPTQDERAALGESLARVLATVEALPDDAFPRPSRLPGWSRAHVAAHLAASADSRVRLLAAARAGEVGRQYDGEEGRRRGIEAGAARPPGEIRAELRAAFDRLLEAVARHPADRWDAPGHWLEAGEYPVRRAVPSMWREAELHHVDLDAGYGPADWPDTFVRGQLRDLVRTLSARPGAPAVTLALPGETLRIGDGAGLTVAGAEREAFAWLTGRGTGHGLRATPPGPLPAPPPLG